MTLKSTFSDVIDFLRIKMDSAHERGLYDIEEKIRYTYNLLLCDFMEEAKRLEEEHKYDEKSVKES